MNLTLTRVSLLASAAFFSSSPLLYAETKTHAQKVELVPMTPQPDFWSKKAKLLTYRCKDMRLQVRSKVSPSTEYNVSSGLFNEKDCKETVKSLETKGCFCDEGALKCLETEKIEPVGIVCPTGFFCFEFRGEKVGLIRVKEIGNHFTRQACMKEFNELDRD